MSNLLSLTKPDRARVLNLMNNAWELAANAASLIRDNPDRVWPKYRPAMAEAFNASEDLRRRAEFLAESTDADHMDLSEAMRAIGRAVSAAAACYDGAGFLLDEKPA